MENKKEEVVFLEENQAKFQKEYFECLYWLARLVDDEEDMSQYEHMAAVQERMASMVAAYEQTFATAFNLIKRLGLDDGVDN